MGDAVWHTVTLRWIKEAWPEARVTALTGKLAVEILESCGYVDEIWLRDWGRWQVGWRTKKAGFDLAYFTYPQRSVVSLVKLCSRALRVGVSDGRGTENLDEFVLEEPDEHAVIGPNRRLLAKVGKSVSGEETKVVIPDEAVAKSRKLIRGSLDNYVAIMAGASHYAKQWPPERFEVVAKSLAEIGVDSVLVGGPSDASLVSDVTVNLAGALSVLETAAVLEGALCVVTNDTGVMHLAGAVGTPVVAIYGPLTPKTHYPPGDEHKLFWSPCQCPVRSVDTCPGTCLLETSVEEVWAAVKEVIAPRMER